MKEVTKEEFDNKIGQLDVEVCSIGNFPYTTNFTLKRNRELIGKTVDNFTDETTRSRPIITKYFLINNVSL